jgi:hypothetical protein
MEKAVSQSDFTSLDKVKERFNPEQDTYVPAKGKKKEYKYTHDRPLPEDVRVKAESYIAVLTAKYPYQLRHLMGIAYWNRFSEMWCDTGDARKSMRAI